MIYQRIDFGTPLFDEAVNLRNKILRIPLNLEFQVKDIEQEWHEHHFGLLLPNQQLIGCLSMRMIDDTCYKMRQVAIDESCQGFGFGKLLVNKSENWCKNNGVSMIVLHARDVAIPFYKKLRYKIIGNAFEEVGIEHYKMQKKIG